MNRLFKSIIIPLSVVLGFSVLPKFNKEPQIIKEQEIVSNVSEQGTSFLFEPKESVEYRNVAEPKSVDNSLLPTISESGIYNLQYSGLTDSINFNITAAWATINIVLENCNIPKMCFEFSKDSESSTTLSGTININFIIKGNNNVGGGGSSAIIIKTNEDTNVYMNFVSPLSGGSISTGLGLDNEGIPITSENKLTLSTENTDDPLIKVDTLGGEVALFSDGSSDYPVSKFLESQQESKTISFSGGYLYAYEWEGSRCVSYRYENYLDAPNINNVSRIEGSVTQEVVEMPGCETNGEGYYIASFEGTSEISDEAVVSLSDPNYKEQRIPCIIDPIGHNYILTYSFNSQTTLFEEYEDPSSSTEYRWVSENGEIETIKGENAFASIPNVVIFTSSCSRCDANSITEIITTREIKEETVRTFSETMGLTGSSDDLLEELGLVILGDIDTRLQFVAEPANSEFYGRGHYEVAPENGFLLEKIGKAVTPEGSYEKPIGEPEYVPEPEPEPIPSGPSQEQIQELAQEITPEITVESFNEILSQVEDVAVLINEVVQFDEKMTENINAIATDSQENAIAIISSVNEAATVLEELKGDLSAEEYEQKVETLQAIVETSCEIAASMNTVAESVQQELPTFEEGSPAASLDLGSQVKDFYQRQLDAILGTGSTQEEYSPMSSSKNNDIIFVFADEPINNETKSSSKLDLDTSADVYRSAIEFIDNSVEDMKNIAKYVRECSNEEFVKHINETISGISHRVFKNFDKAAADAEFVENARKAMVIHLQQETLIALDANYEEVKKSSAYSGNAKETFDRQYQEEREAVSDLEIFEDMLTEIMRQKYVTILNNRLSSKQIDKAKYDELMLGAVDIDTFAPVYDQIFTNWALYQDNDPEYAGITLEELSNTVIGNVTHKTSQINLRSGLTGLEVIFISFVVLAGAAIAYFGYFKNRKKESARA